MANDDTLYLGIDLGGTNIRCGLVTGTNKVIARDSTKTKSVEGSEAVIKRIVKLCENVAAEAGVKKSEIDGLGIGAPGAIDIRTGTVIRAVNLGWKNYPLKEALEDQVKWPVTVDNDANVAAWGEYRAGAGRKLKKCDSLLAVWVGTGVGGGLILNDKIHHGFRLTAGEIGHTIVRSGAGRGRRSLEDLAGRNNLVAMLTRLIQTGHESKMTKIVDGDYSKVRSKALATALAENDPLTLELVQQAAMAVGQAIASTITLLGLPAVILGGGVVEALGDRFVGWVREAFDDAVFPLALRDTKIVASELDDDAGVIGSALLASDENKKR